MPDAQGTCQKRAAQKHSRNHHRNFERIELPGRFWGAEIQSIFNGTGGDTGEAGVTLVRVHGVLFMHRYIRRADPCAFFAIRTTRSIAPDLEWRQPAQRTQESTIGTEKTAPEIGNENRQQKEACQHPCGQGRHVGEKFEHLDVRNPAVWTIEKSRDSGYIHLYQDGPEKKTQQQIFETAQRPVQPARQKLGFSKDPFLHPGQHFGQKSDGTHPAAKRLFQKNGNGKNNRKDHESGRMDGWG